MTKTADNRTKPRARSIARHFDQISESLRHELRRFMARSGKIRAAVGLLEWISEKETRL